MVESETHKARYMFKGKEGMNRDAWIAFEPWDKDLPMLQESGGKHNAFLGFDLKEGTTYEQAREVAQYLNDHVAEVKCTVFK